MRVKVKPEHEVAFQDIAALLKRHADSVSAEELLAIAANMLGKLVALQDQRTMTRERAIAIVQANIEAGNEQAIESLRTSQEGGVQ